MSKQRTEISRGKNRGSYSLEELYEILDEGLVCHVGFIRDNYPVVLPLNYARFNNQIIVHGSFESPFFQTIKGAENICINITLLDGLVLGKSAYNHSVNFRNAVIYGKATEVIEPIEKNNLLGKLIEHVVKNRWENIRKPSEKELESTMVLTIPLQEFSIKSRKGPPHVLASDADIPVWSGVLPLSEQPGPPEGDNFSRNIEPPPAIRNYQRKKHL